MTLICSYQRRIPAFLSIQIARMDVVPNLYRRTEMSNMMKIEAELRHAVIDRLIAASLSDGKPAREATLDRWRALGTRQGTTTQPDASAA
jgi:hypothetical protein